MTAKWHFVRHRPGQPIVNPLGTEHFTTAEDDWRPGETLVRECIQNSLDARHADEEVSVRFFVGNDGSMSAATADFWFGSLWPHLRSPDCRLPHVPRAPNVGGFVVVEDFGTRGLEGDVRQGGLSDVDNRFFNFFRAEGLSGNPLNGTTGGSWGVGKSVFNRCSRINTFLALTGRRAEGGAALIGKSVLRHHRMADGEFQWLGQLGVRDPSNDCMVLPETSGALVNRLVRDFSLARPIEGTRVEPGLSVVIPYVDGEISAEAISEIVIREYFYPILAGRLRVRICGMIRGRQETVDLDAGRLEDEAEQLTRPEIRQVIKLAKWSLDDGPGQAYVLNEPPDGEAPTWTDDLVRPDDPAFGGLCERYERGEEVAIRVPLRVQPSGRRGERTSFVVYLKKDLEGAGYRPVFVRGSIVVPNARQRAVRNHSLFSLVCIDESPLAVMLRAAEPPAHTHWSHETANFRDRYEYGRQTIDFVVRAPSHLAEVLSEARTERDYDVWADMFPSPVPQGDRDAGGHRRRGTRRSPGPIEPPKPRPKPFRIDQIAGGFTVARDNADRTPRPGELEVLVAYDTSRGNPIRRYDPADFRLATMQRVARNVEVIGCEKNRLLFRPLADDFRIEVSGFDGHRDLVVKVRTLEAAAGNEP
jgi:hypothetical protein